MLPIQKQNSRPVAISIGFMRFAEMIYCTFMHIPTPIIYNEYSAYTAWFESSSLLNRIVLTTRIIKSAVRYPNMSLI